MSLMLCTSMPIHSRAYPIMARGALLLHQAPRVRRKKDDAHTAGQESYLCQRCGMKSEQQGAQACSADTVS